MILNTSTALFCYLGFEALNYETYGSEAPNPNLFPPPKRTLSPRGRDLDEQKTDRETPGRVMIPKGQHSMAGTKTHTRNHRRVIDRGQSQRPRRVYRGTSVSACWPRFSHSSLLPRRVRSGPFSRSFSSWISRELLAVCQRGYLSTQQPLLIYDGGPRYRTSLVAPTLPVRVGR